jgi:hypothetical protein
MHPTQVFFSNPNALRVEYRVDDGRLILWWSPLAGQSTDCRDRNYSSRDAHLSVFEEIELPGWDLGSFERCDYDPYHCVLHFAQGCLHLAVAIDQPALLLWSDQPLNVDFKAPRFAIAEVQQAAALQVRHDEPRHQFRFAAAIGAGDGHFRHCHFRAAEQPLFSQAALAAGQPLAIGVGLAHQPVVEALKALCVAGHHAVLEQADAALAAQIACGNTVSETYPQLDALRACVIRSLHSMIDASGAFRASLKAIYYLLWVRDAGFAFPYQAAAGWPHQLAAVCRFILDNPHRVSDPGLPQTRMFGQLIHRELGKLEEDGLYYVVWLLFTHWTQHGHLDFVTEADWALIDEALEWVEAVTWDAQRGLFGEFTADETATYGHRDMGWDYAIGKPTADHHLRFEGASVTRNYDVYFNTCMHSAYTMLTALRGDPRYAAKATRLWPQLQELLSERSDGIPTYGELLMHDGSRIRPKYWGPDAGASCCVWGLSMPNFLPLADADAIHAAVLDAIIAQPEMHFINGICSAISAVDTWVYPEDRCLALHLRLADETNRPGKFLPMGGAMPEKFNAPQGNLYHDIRPQGFAMGAWLAAWSGLGLRRLPYGLAMRPTRALKELSNYTWQGKTLHFAFAAPADCRQLALEIDGTRIGSSLQLPESALRDGSHIRLVEAPPSLLLLRSSARLNGVTAADSTLDYLGHAYGLTRLTFNQPIAHCSLLAAHGRPIPCESTASGPLFHLDFSHHGSFQLSVPLT